MEPKHDNYTPYTELPAPHGDDAQTGFEQSVGAPPEARAAKKPQLTPPTNNPAMASLQTNTQLASSSTDSSLVPTHASSTMIADDNDLIEKEWVIRAKAIVMQTRNDPHTQTAEIHKFKADYLKKRYNKELKVSET